MTTPEITVRTFSDDQYYLDKIFYSNYYRIKEFSRDTESVVLNIGAHTGFFSMLCSMRNATKIYNVEPFIENFKMLVKNTEVFSDKTENLRLGVLTENKFSNFGYPTMDNNMFMFGHTKIHSSEERKDLCPCVTLDELLYAIDEPRIHLLKINLGYSEADILTSSERIDKCDFVCGESSASEEKLKHLVSYMNEKGFNDSFLAKSKESEEASSHLFLFAKEKCENLFNMYTAAPPDSDTKEVSVIQEFIQ